MPLIRLPTWFCQVAHSPRLAPVHSYPLSKSLSIAFNQEPNKTGIILIEVEITVESPKPFFSEEETWARSVNVTVEKVNYWEVSSSLG